MEIIPNSISIHDLKKNCRKKKKKKEFFTKKSQKFIESLVGYSLFCFFLQVKDRHNANILLNPHNRLIHIDFGFIMGENPGNLSFEASNFKFSKEFILEIGGKKKEGYELFKDLFLRGFFAIRKNFAKLFRTSRKLLFNNSENYSKKNKLGKFQKRINISKKDNFLIKFIISFIEESAESWKTYQYDRYQLHASGIN
jgi:phosphatidylinositol kinase/protein kinase (PI-3  family)